MGFSKFLALFPFKAGFGSFIFSLFGVNVMPFLDLFDVFKLNIPK